MKKIIIFGTGNRLNYLMENGYLNDFEIVAFCDNDVKKQGTMIGKIEVITPKRLQEYQFDAVYISSDIYFEEIYQELKNVWNVDPDMIQAFSVKKYDGEMCYWKKQFLKEGEKFNNLHYEKLMLGIAQEVDDGFLKGKIVADFGCGPRGSLKWTDKPLIKLGIDVLAKDYMDNFGGELAGHGMIYVTSSEKKIPLPTGFVDCLFTINSLDHVDNLDQMTEELLRILKPGGILLASFNLNEPKTDCEPQTLTEDFIKNVILNHFMIDSYRLAYKAAEDPYENIFLNKMIPSLGDGEKPAVLWVKGTKK